MPDPTERYIPPGQFTRLWEQALPEVEPPPPKPVAPPPPPPPSPLDTILSLVQRPQQAVFALAGGEGLEGAGSALFGGARNPFAGGAPVPERPPTRAADLLTRWGVPEGPRLSVGPLDVSARDVLGAEADIFWDPLNAVPIHKALQIGKATALVKPGP